ncbi:MAG: hypothetical protein B7X78_08765, partial [Sphingomonadales bacterium 39-62-4]
VVCLTRQSTGARDGCTFGYKDMTETMGPCESDCPAAILDELTETDSTYASEWRARCRANLVRRKLERAKPVPKPGQTIVFDESIRFNDGEDRNRFTVIANPKGKVPLFRDPITGAVCRIAKFRTRAYRLINPAIVPKDTTDG